MYAEPHRTLGWFWWIHQQKGDFVIIMKKEKVSWGGQIFTQPWGWSVLDAEEMLHLNVCFWRVGVGVGWGSSLVLTSGCGRWQEASRTQGGWRWSLTVWGREIPRAPPYDGNTGPLYACASHISQLHFPCAGVRLSHVWVLSILSLPSLHQLSPILSLLSGSHPLAI